jgi:hypothetical protein
VTLPSGIRACLWSWDPSSLDLRRDRRLIITQVLNYGRWDDVRWLLKHYKGADFRRVLRDPARGQWLPDVLNFWTHRLNIRLSKNRIQTARFSIQPAD